MVPTLIPFNLQRYVGEAPPLVGVAVNVTLVPEQIELSASFEDTLTLAATLGFTTVVILLEVAGEPVIQGVALDVITTVTMLLLANVVVVYVALLVPTLAPFTFH